MRVDRTVQWATLRKLELIHAAKDVEDLQAPRQWRLCFVWKEEGAEDVELVDYH